VTVEDPTTIDRVTKSDDGTRYTLVMVEQRPLEMSDEQVEQILRKVNRYLQAILSGELYQIFPDARGKKIGVRLVVMDEPNHPRMAELIEVVGGYFLKEDMEFVVEVIPRTVED
jgi:hypothetical protein